MTTKEEREVEEAIAKMLLEGVQRIRLAITAARGLRRKGREATPVVGHLVRMIREIGGHFPVHPHAIRQAIEESPQPLDDEGAYKATPGVVARIIEAISAKSGDDEHADTIGLVWPEHATKADAAKATDEVRRASQPAQQAPAPRVAAQRAPGAPTRTGNAMPLVDRASGPPGTWVDGEYVVEEFVRHPTVG